MSMMDLRQLEQLVLLLDFYSTWGFESLRRVGRVSTPRSVMDSTGVGMWDGCTGE